MDDHRLGSFREEEPSSTPINLSTGIDHLDSVMMQGEPLAGDRELEVTLREFVINCSPKDPALDGMEVVVYGIREEDAARTEKINPTTWRYHREIQLRSGMDEFKFFVKSKDESKDIGYIAFSKGELAAFMTINHSIELEIDFKALKENGPSLRLNFTLVVPDITSAISRQQSSVSLTPEEHADMALWLNNIGVAFQTRFNRNGELADIVIAISTLQRAVNLIPEEHENMPVWLSNLGLAFRRRFDHTGNLADLEVAIHTQKKAVALAPEVHASMPVWLNDLSISFRRRFERTGIHEDIEIAISTQQRAVYLVPKGHSDMPVWFNNLALCFLTRFNRTGNFEDLETAISTQRRAVDLTPEGHAGMPVWLNDLGISLRRRFDRTGNLTDLENAISNQKRAISLAPKDHAAMPVWLNDLSISYRRRFERTGNLEDIEISISTQQRAADLVPKGRPDIYVWLNNLALCFRARFNRTGILADLEFAISNQQRAVDLVPKGHPDLPVWLNDLGISFQRRFDRTGDLKDLEIAISTLQKAVDLTPEGHAGMPVWLNDLAVSYRRRFERTGNLEDIEIATSTQQRAADLVPKGHPDMPMWLNNLALCFRARFNRTGNLADIEIAISTSQRAVELTPKGHAGMPVWLNDLGISLRRRFDRTGVREDIENAISTQQRAVDLAPEGHVSTPVWLNDLAISYRRRFERTGNLEDIETAISTQQKAVDLVPEGHPDMPMWLSNLALCFQTRFNRTGNLADIETAISTLQRAVHLTPEGHVGMPVWLNDLGISFRTRFDRTGNFADLEITISTQKRAVGLAPEGHAAMPVWLNDLGISFRRRFERTENLEDIEMAISTQQRAVELVPKGHPDMSMWLNNLALSFLTRFNRTGNLADLEIAIFNQQSAVDLAPEGHAAMHVWLSDLGISFRRRFDRTSNLADLDIAISTQQRAVDLTPEGHARNSPFLMSLAHSLVARFASSHNTEDIHAAISMLRCSATQHTGHPSTRLDAARDWAKYSRIHDKSQLLDAYSVAIQLLPQVAGLEQTIHKRHQSLINVSNVTASATAAAIDNNNLEMAIAWLEQGRCLVWNQIDRLRSPAEDLRRYNPSLADRFSRVAHALEVSGSRQERHSTFLEGNMTEMISLQDEVHAHVRLATEWDELLREIRSISEFQDFLQPPQASNLLSRLPPNGTIVIFNIHEDRCDALALTSGHDSPVHIPLKTFRFERAIQLRDEMRRYLKDCHVRQRREGGRDMSRRHPQDPEGVVMFKVLRELWEDVVKPILDALAYSPKHSSQPRLWWCPTGALAFLPIHAAGIYSKEGTSGRCVSDYMVSSYTPTIGALLDKIKESPNTHQYLTDHHARQQQDADRRIFRPILNILQAYLVHPFLILKLYLAAKTKEATTTDLKPTSVLIISQPSTPGQSPIPGAKKEAHALRKMIGPPSSSLLLEDTSATVIRVKEEMKTHAWVHFACHAIQDTAEPLKSGVQLDDGRLEVLEMLKQTLPNADLAFLSACQTSTGDEKLADEVVHLAAGMLAAGYMSVVATMWSIKDQYGPNVANDFYSYIFKLAAKSEDRQLDGADAAHALHYATQKLRKKLGDTEAALLIWVPYIHFGV